MQNRTISNKFPSSRTHFPKSLSPSSTRLSSPRMMVMKSPSAQVLKESPVPPWLQDVRLVPQGMSKNALNITDFWTQGQRYSTIKRLHLVSGESRIKSVFRQRENEEKRKSLSKKINSLKFKLHLDPLSPRGIPTDLGSQRSDNPIKIQPHTVKHSTTKRRLSKLV
jgi:hypothetical protein